VFTKKTWGAIIGALAVFSIFLIGFEETVLVIVAGVIGFFVGKFLEGELDLSALQERAQGRR
jgi:uncharacterized membrane protein